MYKIPRKAACHILFKRVTTLLLTMVVYGVAQVALAAPAIQHWETDNGLRVFYVEAPQLPMLDMRLVFNAGSARDAEFSGLAHLTSALLNKGAAGKNADAIAEAFESVGAIYHAGADKDRSYVSLRTLTLANEMEQAVSTWIDVLAKPTFPEEDYARLITQLKTSLKAKKQAPGVLAYDAFMKHLYGEHPYANPVQGTEESIASMDLAKLKAFYKSYYVANNGVLALVGNIKRKQAEQLANRVAQALTVGQPAPAIPELSLSTRTAKTIHIEFPSEQTHIYMGQLGEKRGDVDFFPLYAGNHVLGGGGFTSRLMKEIRVKHGLSYGVSSSFRLLREYGPFMISMQTKNDQTSTAIAKTKDIVDAFVLSGPTESELSSTIKNITGGFPLRTASNTDIVSAIATIGFYGLPLNYLSSFSDMISQVKRSEIQKVFKKRIDPANFLIVTVGRKLIEDKKTNITEDAKPQDGNSAVSTSTTEE